MRTLTTRRRRSSWRCAATAALFFVAAVAFARVGRAQLPIPTFAILGGVSHFNLSTAETTTVLELAELIWKKINGEKPFRVVRDPGMPYDVQMRYPQTEKAKRMLGFEATTPLDTVLDEVIPWVQEEIKQGRI